jgi:quinoprotein relay system zinc metallohydrolase 2
MPAPRVLRHWLCAAASAGVMSLSFDVSGASPPPLAMQQIAPGVYVHAGRQEDWSDTNGGDIANIGFVIGERCVAVVDTGSTPSLGAALRAAVAAATPRPVCYVINTHVHPDHVLGNAAFLLDRPQFVGHAKLAAALAAKGPTYLATLQRTVGVAPADVPLVPPSLAVGTEQRLDLGGRTLVVRAWPTAHTDNDVTVWDGATRTLWTGDLLFVERIPSLDGSLRGWVKVLSALAALPAAQVVPGHGPVQHNWPAAAAPITRYLERLLAGTRTALRDGRTIQEAVDSVAQDEAARWPLAELYHRRNVTAAFAELEWEE